MTKITELNRPQDDSIEEISLKNYTEKAYLNYSMYVILDRALPFIGDGLKPVQRRIVYAMSELGLKSTAKYKKSARTVGDVLGKFHPHGDSACYEAMVLMAQHFSYRYPLIDGQGNWGSPDDPKSFAAMRYTEARLASYADLLLSELEQGTVNWGPNFDGTLDEPKTLPARLPNLLLNGTTGIAVGMATDILPHNLTEIANACVQLIDNPDLDLAALTKIVPGPDFPTQAEIISSKKEILECYQTGRGSIRMRATFVKEDGDIVITHLPYQVSGAKILEQIAAQMIGKKLPLVSDIRDESDHENPTRLIITPKSNRVDIDGLMAHLFATTDLERSYRVNLNMIGLDQRPQVKDLKTILSEWLDYRKQTVKRRLEFRLNKVIDRLHILDGLLIAFLNIDEVIAIIRHEEHPKAKLIERFQLSDLQAEAILELKLRHLAKLEEMKIRGEQDDLQNERKTLEDILASPKKLNNLIKKEIEQDRDRFGDARRSPIVEREEAKALKETDLVSAEPITVILSEKGWIRAAKGFDIDPESLSYKSGDKFLSAAQGKSNQSVVILDSTGRTYTLPTHGLPSARGQGEPLTGRINPPSGASFIGMMLADNSAHFLIASDAGYGFITPFEETQTKNRAGKALLSLPKESLPLPPVFVNNIETDLLIALSSEARLLVFPVKELPILNKGKGNKIISIPSARATKREELLTHVIVIPHDAALLITAGKRTLTLKPQDIAHYLGERGKRGNKLPRGLQKVDTLKIAN